MSDNTFIESFAPHEILGAQELLQCATGPATASGFRRALLLLLRLHFSSSANFGTSYQHLGCYTYAPDHGGTVEIDTLPRVAGNDTHTEDYPSIMVGFGAVDLTRMVMGDIHHLSDDMASRVLIQEAGASFNIQFMLKNAGDAYDAAEMTASMLMALAAPLMMNTGARSFAITGWGEPKQTSPSPNRYYTVAMNVRVVYNFLARLHEESHRVRSLITQVTAT